MIFFLKNLYLPFKEGFGSDRIKTQVLNGRMPTVIYLQKNTIYYSQNK